MQIQTNEEGPTAMMRRTSRFRAVLSSLAVATFIALSVPAWAQDVEMTPDPAEIEDDLMAPIGELRFEGAQVGSAPGTILFPTENPVIGPKDSVFIWSIGFDVGQPVDLINISRPTFMGQELDITLVGTIPNGGAAPTSAGAAGGSATLFYFGEFGSELDPIWIAVGPVDDVPVRDQISESENLSFPGIFINFFAGAMGNGEDFAIVPAPEPQGSVLAVVALSTVAAVHRFRRPRGCVSVCKPRE
jgi:hypothetical protein